MFGYVQAGPTYTNTCSCLTRPTRRRRTACVGCAKPPSCKDNTVFSTYRGKWRVTLKDGYNFRLPGTIPVVPNRHELKQSVIKAEKLRAREALKLRKAQEEAERSDGRIALDLTTRKTPKKAKPRPKPRNVCFHSLTTPYPRTLTDILDTWNRSQERKLGLRYGQLERYRFNKLHATIASNTAEADRLRGAKALCQLAEGPSEKRIKIETSPSEGLSTTI